MTQNSVQANLFDTIDGLPIHPLAVHGAVVLLPLAAIALAILIFVPKWRQAYLPLTLGALAVSTALAYLAKESGEALAQRVGEPQTHADLGDILFPASAGLTALAVAFFFLQRKERPKWQVQAVAATALLGIASVSTLTYFVGHTGAQATWASRIAPPEAIAESPAASGTANSTVALTLTEIAKHSTREDCWTAVEGTVYDLTPYMQKHPGGAAALAWLCGIDGTTAYRSQHGNESSPMSALASLAIGPLVEDGAAPTATDPVAEPSATTAPSAAAGTYTSVEVAKHNSGSDCWSVVNGNVYDLTSYVSSHPGGSSVIKAICGKDGSAAFSGQHAGAGKPNNVLASFKLGALAAGSQPKATTAPSAAAGTYTSVEVAKHNSGSDCWSVVNGNVYDLTSYVSSHPGGSSVIKAICGKDGSAAFSGQHAGAGKPNNVLASFKLGALAAGSLPQATTPAGSEHEEDDDDDDEDDDDD